MMKRTATWLLAAIVAACATNSSAVPETVQWDSTAARDAQAAVEKGVNALAAMDMAGVDSTMAEDGYVPSYDTDLESKPLRLATRDDALKYVSDIVATLKGMNATLQINKKSIDCRATSTLAFCALDNDVVATMPDGKTMTQPGRATFVLSKVGDAWKWVHFHSSPAGAPPAPASK